MRYRILTRYNISQPIRGNVALTMKALKKYLRAIFALKYKSDKSELRYR